MNCCGSTYQITEKMKRRLARMMEGYGFRFERPVGWLSEPKTGEILQMDALFAREG